MRRSQNKNFHKVYCKHVFELVRTVKISMSYHKRLCGTSQRMVPTIFFRLLSDFHCFSVLVLRSKTASILSFLAVWKQLRASKMLWNGWWFKGNNLKTKQLILEHSQAQVKECSSIENNSHKELNLVSFLSWTIVAYSTGLLTLSFYTAENPSEKPWVLIRAHRLVLYFFFWHKKLGRVNNTEPG